MFEANKNITTLILPGLGGSWPKHWQSLWEQANPEFVRVQQRDWDNPVCEEWVAVLEKAVAEAGPETVLVAHSLGCHTVAHWAAQTSHKIKGALLVAPPDLNAPGGPPEVIGFTPVPMKILPFDSIVVASTDDPYASIDFQQACAQVWGSHFKSVGQLGHINASSGIGEWQEGYIFLKELMEKP